MPRPHHPLEPGLCAWFGGSWTRRAGWWLVGLVATWTLASPCLADDLFDHLAPKPHFEHLTSDDGLPHDVVFTLAEDPDGFLWMGTEGGPCRYDGVNFRRWGHDPENPDSLTTDDISLIVPEGDTGLWFGTWGGGLEHLDLTRETFRHHPAVPGKPNRLQDGRVQALWLDDPEAVWIGTFGGGLARLDRASGQITNYRHDPDDASTLPHDRVWAIQADAQGTLWVGTQGGLAKLRPDGAGFDRLAENLPEDVDIHSVLAHGQVRALLLNSSGTLWVGTAKGLFRQTTSGSVESDSFESDRFAQVTLPAAENAQDASDPTEGVEPDIINVLYQDRQAGLWIGTNGGGLVHCPSPQAPCVRHRHRADDPSSLSLDDVRDILQDRAGNLWIATRGGGVDKLPRVAPRFRHLRRGSSPQELPSRFVWAFEETPEGEVLVGTGRGLLQTGPRSFLTTASGDDATSLPDSHVTDLLVDPRGDLWVATFEGGLARRRAGQQGFERFRHDPDAPGSLASDHVHRVVATRAGDVWVGTRRGLDRFVPETGRFEHHRSHPDAPLSLADDLVRDLLEAPDGRLWVGTDGGWLHRFDPASGVFERFGTAEGFPKGRVNALHWQPDPETTGTAGTTETDRGTLWIATDKGLVRRLDPAPGDGSGFEVIDLRHGLPSPHVTSIEVDTQGRLWLGTDQGLARYSPDDGTVRVYHVRDGLPGRELLDRASFRDRRGRLFFGGIDGLTVFDPAQVEDLPNTAPVVLTGFYRFNQRQTFDPPGVVPASIALEPSDDFIAFTFAHLDFADPRGNRYRYRLEGFDRQWVEAGERRRADYTNLDPGDYVFRVEAANSRGVWSEHPLAVAVTIPPPVWQTWWFRLLCVGLVGASIWGLHRRRVASIVASERRLERRVEEALNDLRQAEESLHQAKKLESLGLMAGGIAHDFNNLLMVITGSCEMLRLQVANAAADGVRPNEYLGLIEQAAKQASELSLQMLAYVGQGSLDKEPLDPLTLLREQRGALEALTGLGGLTVRLPTELPVVHADPKQLRQALVHLVTNSVEAQRPGVASHIVVSAQAVDCDIDDFAGTFYDSPPEPGPFVVLRVEDNGTGMDPATLENIFDPFFTTKFTGRGLGLAFVWGVVRGHHGAIDVRSHPGEGTTIQIFLPAERDPAVQPVAPADPVVNAGVKPIPEAEPSPAKHAPTRPHSDGVVLLVDDEPGVRQVGRSLLESLGFEVMTAPGGAEAIELLERDGETVQLVVLDLTMPGLGGAETFDALRARHPTLPILLASGYDQHHASQTMRQRSIDGFLQKPYQREALELALARALEPV